MPHVLAENTDIPDTCGIKNTRSIWARIQDIPTSARPKTAL
jgi:hypothetical protein